MAPGNDRLLEMGQMTDPYDNLNVALAADDVPTVEDEIPHIAETALAVAMYPNDPAEMVHKAVDQATALRDVIESRGMFATINRRKFITVEGWTTLGAMVGVFPYVVWTEPYGTPDDNGRQHGWQARVEARYQGQPISAAESQCDRGESNWKNRDDFALRSMAQTRATSKALRLPLGFVIAIAGYEATPEAEMPSELPREVPAGTVEPDPDKYAKGKILALAGGDKDTANALWADAWLHAPFEKLENMADAEVLIEAARTAKGLADA